MAVMDEFREEREALKNAGLKKRISYFLYYYKWHVIIGILVIAGVGSVVYEMVTSKDNAFYAVMLNATELEPAAEFNQAFYDYAGIDLNEYNAFFDASIRISSDTGMADSMTMTSVQKLAVYLAAAELDVMVTDSASIQQYANSSAFYDLRDILSEEQILQYEPYFYYVDMAVVRRIEESKTNLDDTYEPTYADPTKPEDMAEPVPVGLYVDNAGLMESYYFSGEDVVIGVYSNTTHREAALKFIDYLMN